MRKHILSPFTSAKIRVSKLIGLAGAFLLLACEAPSSAADCLEKATLLRTDASYERALVEDNFSLLENLIHPTFNWVHNHASYIEQSRDALLAPMKERRKAGKDGYSVRREQSNLVYLRHGATGVIHGFTDVYRDKTKLNGPDKQFTRYHFMRTYAMDKGSCKLLANHTMEIPEK